MQLCNIALTGKTDLNISSVHEGKIPFKCDIQIFVQRQFNKTQIINLREKETIMKEILHIHRNRYVLDVLWCQPIKLIQVVSTVKLQIFEALNV